MNERISFITYQFKNGSLNNRNPLALKRSIIHIHVIVIYVQLDFVDDPGAGAVLENMKANHIGNKR